jgi:cytochrome P450
MRQGSDRFGGLLLAATPAAQYQRRETRRRQRVTPSRRRRRQGAAAETPLARNGVLQSLDRSLPLADTLLLAEDEHFALVAHPIVDIALIAVQHRDGLGGKHLDSSGSGEPVDHFTCAAEPLDVGFVVDPLDVERPVGQIHRRAPSWALVVGGGHHDVNERTRGHSSATALGHVLALARRGARRTQWASRGGRPWRAHVLEPIGRGAGRRLGDGSAGTWPLMSTHRNRLTGWAAAATLADLGGASIAAGVLARRRPVVRALERLQGDARAVTRMQRLRDQFGKGPVELIIPGRRIVVLLDPEDVGRVLAETPAPFHPANREKRKALGWFQPHGVLISRGPIRERRRVVNEAALDTQSDMHRLAPLFTDVIALEMRKLIGVTLAEGHLDSAMFMTAWWRMVRRLVLGSRARDDETITNSLLRLRKAGNWSFLSLPHYRRRNQFFEKLYHYAEQPESGSLISALAEVPSGGAVDPIGQVPQWIFAFDAAGMAVCRALALLATHPEQHALAMVETDQPGQPLLRPYLRACLLESVRIWPTTPTILRDTTEDTSWRAGAERFSIAKGAGLMIVTPAFHRDDQLLPFAHQFIPDIWLDGRAQQHAQLVPFSAGPAECPGRNLVLLVSSTVLANLIGSLTLGLTSTPHLSPEEPLPKTLNQFTLKFDAQPAHHHEQPSLPATS